MTKACRFLDLGFLGYAEALALQTDLVERRARGEAPDTLLLVEHPPVVTLGRRARRADLADPGCPVFEIARGGEATYHGPGQLVGYPILKLDERRIGLRGYLRALEETLIRAIGDFGIEGSRREGLTGAWVGPRKIASIGVAVRRWVSYHGFGLNVKTEPAAFARIRPCGLDPCVMTSMTAEAGREVCMADVKARVASRFAEVFSLRLLPVESAQAPSLL
ncbi:MAG: lipoyl(octanoyl) transferase LipB [Planctomycetota bacterium]